MWAAARPVRVAGCGWLAARAPPSGGRGAQQRPPAGLVEAAGSADARSTCTRAPNDPLEAVLESCHTFGGITLQSVIFCDKVVT